MKKIVLPLLMLTTAYSAIAQKKPLDHSVYDSWESVSRLVLSKDGKWIAYNINVQEGDNRLVIQSTDNHYKKVIDRGYDARFTGDNKALVFKISPLYAETRQARIKKKKPEEFPKDSFGILRLGGDNIQKYPQLLSYKIPKEANEWIAVLLKNELSSSLAKTAYKADKTKDSLQQVIDSLQYLVQSTRPARANGKDSLTSPGRDNRLLLIHTDSREPLVLKNVSDYVFNKTGTDILVLQTLNLQDTAKTSRLVLYNLSAGKADTVVRGGNDFKNLALSDDGSQLAFAGRRFARLKEPIIYKLWYYQKGMDSAIALVDTSTRHLPQGSTVSELAKIAFNTTGSRLIFGTSAVKPPKDTTVADIDKVNVDIWHYKEDYLQPYQLENQKRDREKSYLAVYDLVKKELFQVGSPGLPDIYEASKSDARFFMAVTDTGRRVSSQWTGSTPRDIYRVDIDLQKFVPAIANLDGTTRPSWMAPSGKYIVWYDNKLRNYYSFDGVRRVNISEAIKLPLYDEENDMPNDPAPYGLMGWANGDSAVFLYDRYDIWEVDPEGEKAPVNITGNGRKSRTTYRFVTTDPDEDYIKPGDKNLLRVFDNTTKKSGLAILKNHRVEKVFPAPQAVYYDQPTRSRDEEVYAYTKENYRASPDVYVYLKGKEHQLSAINPQQAQYNWGTASLYHWKTFSGKPATGILYKPENFDTNRKYPVILYFYEKLSDGLNRYQPPAPTASRLNISFFVSRGYIVLAPDISYTIGHPAKSAYDYIVSGAKDLTRNNWVNAARMGIQGQSWGGIQVAQLVTMTDMFAAAWSGAPVANMTSAYGGIRWSSGLNRQFQYERTQSRIGATLWEKPELYIENSPLFHLPAVKTPMVIMHNDRDGAVPWYQGIELFTGLRRLGKPVWMLNYNGEEHNLMQRKNRKDIQVREQQFFDWLLKGEPPAKWLIEGVPAIHKGNDLGLEQVK